MLLLSITVQPKERRQQFQTLFSEFQEEKARWLVLKEAAAEVAPKREDPPVDAVRIRKTCHPDVEIRTPRCHWKNRETLRGPIRLEADVDRSTMVVVSDH